MSSDKRRARRVAELLRAHLVDLLRDLADPRLANLIVTGVELGDDLSVARVGVRLLSGDGAGSRRALLKALEHAAPRLRKHIGPRLDLRRVPELRFHFDEGLDASQRVEELLGEIAREDAAKKA